jgi:hypothetical protein
MRRDPYPVAIAAATAIVSCGLLALAIARGWLGPDVGWGTNFCEAPRDGVIRQPVNTFSNVGFVVAGLLIAVHASHRPDGYPMPRPLAILMACVVVLLGPASAAMHATQSSLGGRLDQASMALLAAFATGYAVMRWWRGDLRLFLRVVFIAAVFFVLTSRLPVDVPVVRHSGNVAFAVLLAVVIAVEMAIVRRGGIRIRTEFVYGSLTAMVSAFAIWFADTRWLCAPHSPLQGHAVWHVLCAVAAYLLYRYYASERPATGERLPLDDTPTTATAG